MIKKSSTTIWVTTQFSGYHCWNDAPEIVSFLRNKHRHIFHVKVEVFVKEYDREIEFFLFKYAVDHIIQSLFPTNNSTDVFSRDLGEHSCEMLCNKINNALHSSGYSVKSVTVSEDGENGATLWLNG